MQNLASLLHPIKFAHGELGMPGELETTALKTEPSPKRETAVLVNDPLWYKDAIIYEVHVRSFYDSVDDGMRDFEVFLREAHRRDLRVITELVLNHTSDQHQWFQRSRRAKLGSHWRNFYVWSDTPEKYK